MARFLVTLLVFWRLPPAPVRRVGLSGCGSGPYVLEVEITEVKDPPADGSSLHYRLVRTVESTPGAA